MIDYILEKIGFVIVWYIDITEGLFKQKTIQFKQTYAQKEKGKSNEP